MQGGFIWDLVDQGLLPIGVPETAADQAHPPKYCYGGDFGDVPNTKQFCINGLLGPDRKPHPAAFEAAHLQCPVHVQLLNTAYPPKCSTYKGDLRTPSAPRLTMSWKQFIRSHLRNTSLRRFIPAVPSDKEIQPDDSELCLMVINRRNHSKLNDVTLSVSLQCDMSSSLPAPSPYDKALVSLKTVHIKLDKYQILSQNCALIRIVDIFEELAKEFESPSGSPPSNGMFLSTPSSDKLSHSGDSQARLSHLVDHDSLREDLATWGIRPPQIQGINEVFLSVQVSSSKPFPFETADASYRRVMLKTALIHEDLTRQFKSYIERFGYLNTPVKTVVPNFNHSVYFERVDRKVSPDDLIRVVWWNSAYVTVSGKTGQIVRWVDSNGKVLVDTPLDICTWRAVTDNDRGGGVLSHESRWRIAGYDKLSLTNSKSCKIERCELTADGSVSIRVVWELNGSESIGFSASNTVACRGSYTFARDLSVLANITLDLPFYFPTLPRFGLRFAMPKEAAERCCWFGLGPHEAYSDRKTSAYLGHFESSVSDMHTHYVYPQESGSRAEPR